jgi:hypothetical protein
MFRTLKSNSPFSAPRDDTARASCGNGAKSDFLSLEVPRYFFATGGKNVNMDVEPRRPKHSMFMPIRFTNS